MKCIGVHSKIESYYSPMARQRSNTITTSREGMFQKCHSTKSMSSNGQMSATQLKPMNKGLNTPYRNIQLSYKADQTDIIKNQKSEVEFDDQSVFTKQQENRFRKEPETCKNNTQPLNFEFAAKAAETNTSGLNKSQLKFRGLHSVKNNIDVQKVREVIMGSIDTSTSEYGAHEIRKLRFLNSLDENKDLDMFRKKVKDTPHR